MPATEELLELTEELELLDELESLAELLLVLPLSSLVVPAFPVFPPLLPLSAFLVTAACCFSPVVPLLLPKKLSFPLPLFSAVSPLLVAPCVTAAVLCCSLWLPLFSDLAFALDDETDYSDCFLSEFELDDLESLFELELLLELTDAAVGFSTTAG